MGQILAACCASFLTLCNKNFTNSHSSVCWKTACLYSALQSLPPFLWSSGVIRGMKCFYVQYFQLFFYFIVVFLCFLLRGTIYCQVPVEQGCFKANCYLNPDFLLLLCKDVTLRITVCVILCSVSVILPSLLKMRIRDAFAEGFQKMPVLHDSHSYLSLRDSNLL